MPGKVKTRTVTTRVTQEASRILSLIATDIFLHHVDAHRKLKLRGPNNRVAIDYLISSVLTEDTDYEYGYDDKKNLYMQILRAERKV